MLTWPAVTLSTFSNNDTTLNRPMTTTEVSLCGSLYCIGALVSTPIAGYYMDKVGRKYCSIAASLAYVISWSLIIASSRVEVILIAIFLSGFGCSIILVVPIFIGEFCQESIRGAMSSCPVIFYSLGMLIVYLLGGYVEYNVVTNVGIMIAVITIVVIMFTKESPVVLMKKGLENEAAKSIAFYRSSDINSKEVLKEMDAIRRALNPNIKEIEEEVKLNPENQKQKKLIVWQFFNRSESTRRATYILMTILTASFFQGLIVIYVYAEPLFSEAVPNVPPTVCSALLAIVGMVAGLTTTYLIEKSGRKPLMIWSSLISGVCCALLGTQLQFRWGPQILTVIIIYLFNFVYTCGPGTVPYVLAAEIFLPEVRSVISMLAIEWSWLCNFILLFVFNPLVSVIGLGPLFYLFACVCFITSVYCFFFLPETKGLTVDVIQDLFVRKHKRRAITLE